MAQMTVWNTVEQHYETFDDDARTVTVTDAQGVEVQVRPYTATEEAAADQRAAQPALDQAHEDTKERVRLIIDELQAEKDRCQAVIDKTNAQITGADTKDVARAAKRIADAAIDLAKYVDGR